MLPATPLLPIPEHIAIIMDGNGRWARSRGLPRIEGHRRGVDSVRNVLEGARALGVRVLTLYAFSVENWRRPEDEVGGLMLLLETFLKREKAELLKNKVRLRAIGRLDALPARARAALADTMAATEHFTESTLVLALNYGARTEVLDAARSFAAAVAAGTATLDDVSTWEGFSQHLYTRDLPDPDLVIRTSGESRLSNFLLVQAAYAEFVFSPVLWPDFGRAELEAAVNEYRRRERRYGMTGQQIAPPISTTPSQASLLV
ncbi:MAG: di-trans,poly-cis-decaprenylcistransferase [Verrucomicrobia bacterium]|nr:MAG: di-trans,poly-cis-decaprenylcistransferase [Verrucomicrobiota bacterium]